MRYALLFSFILITLVACSRTEFLNTVFVPSQGYTLHKDIPYSDTKRGTLDIYVPDTLQAPSPVIVFFYGGSWKHGNKNDYRFVGEAFASKGYVTVIADYRLYPEARFPAFLEDGAAAVYWVHAHIAEYKGDNRNLFVAGHSAGAHIAMMLTLNDAYLKAAGGSRTWIQGAIGLAGPYDFLPLGNDIKDIFSETAPADTQPITFAAAHMPPIFLATGDEDEDVRPKNTTHLTEKLRSYHNSVTEKIYPNVAHIGIALALAHGFRHKAPVLEDIDQFIRDNRTHY